MRDTLPVYRPPPWVVVGAAMFWAWLLWVVAG